MDGYFETLLTVGWSGLMGMGKENKDGYMDRWRR